MKNYWIKFLGLLLFSAFLIISCAGTELTEKPVAEVYHGKPVSDIMVIAITGNEHNRQAYEQKFVAHLKSVGVDAISSEEVIPMPPDLEMDVETILDAVEQHENDAVIITHLIDKDVEDVYTRDSMAQRGFHGFYLSRFSYTQDTGYSNSSTTLRLETNLYHVKTDKLIWSGETKTWGKDSTDQNINDTIKALIDNLLAKKLIGPK